MISQIGIALFGATAVWLSQDSRESFRRWACIAGMCSQPFWFWSSYQAEQWGIFAISFVYAYGWFRGVRTYWLNGSREQ